MKNTNNTPSDGSNPSPMDCEHEYTYDDQQSEPHKGHDYYYCPKCKGSWVLNEDEQLVEVDVNDSNWKLVGETPSASAEISNTCTCTVFDDETGESSDEPAPDCYGDCWNDSVYFFGLVTEELRNNNTTDWWQVDNLRLWNGDFGGLFHAKTVTELIQGMTVRSEWIMRYEVFSNRIEYSLSHHDAPTGSVTTLIPVTEESRIELGLF